MARARAAFALLTVGFALDLLLAVVTAAGQRRGVPIMILGVGTGAALLAGVALLFRATAGDKARALLLLAIPPIVAQTLVWFFLFRGGFDAGVLVAALLVIPVAHRALARGKGSRGAPVAGSSVAAGAAGVVALAQLALLLAAHDAKRFLMGKLTFAPSEILAGIALVAFFASARARAGAPKGGDDEAKPPGSPGASINPAPRAALAGVVALFLLRLSVGVVLTIATVSRVADLRSALRLLPPVEGILGLALAATMARFARSGGGVLAWVAAAFVAVGALVGLYSVKLTGELADAKTLEAMQAAAQRAGWAGAAGSIAILVAFTFLAGAVAALLRPTDPALAREARGTASVFAAIAPLPVLVAISANMVLRDPTVRELMAGVGPGVAGLVFGANVALLRVLVITARE